MSRAISIRAPKSMELQKTSPEKIEKYVEELSEKALSALPPDVRPVGVNMVKLDQIVAGTNLEPGVWVEWTRACCGHRNRIDDFVMPSVDEIRHQESASLVQAGEQHAEVQLKVITLEYPRQHRS